MQDKCLFFNELNIFVNINLTLEINSYRKFAENILKNTANENF